jgi:hypothetical protein
MLLDFDVRMCSRRCSSTDRELQPGEVYFSVLEEQGTEFVRHDYCVEAWLGGPHDCLGWWRARVPTKNDAKPQLAPTDVMLNVFATLENRQGEETMRYLLGLVLLRRRALRREDSHRNEEGQEVLTLYCPRRDEQFELIVSEPDVAQAEQLQQRMIDLLYGDGETDLPPDIPATD